VVSPSVENSSTSLEVLGDGDSVWDASESELTEIEVSPVSLTSSSYMIRSLAYHIILPYKRSVKLSRGEDCLGTI